MDDENAIGVPAKSVNSTVSRSATIGKLAGALAKAQGEMRNPPKDSINPHFKSKYADLATVRDSVIPALSKHGLSVLQLPCEFDGFPALTTLLLHESGEFVETTMLLRAGKQDPQGVGSAVTYARRYSLQSIAGVAADADDDGNAASRTQQQRPQQQQPDQYQLLASRLRDAKTLSDLGEVWKSVPSDLMPRLAPIKDERKAALSPAQPPKPPAE